MEPKAMSQEALHTLAKSLWPGNVRELKNLVERLAVTVKSDLIDMDDLPNPYNAERVITVREELSPFYSFTSLDDARAEFEKEFIKSKFKSFDQDPDKTAQALGISKEQLVKALSDK